eukprot:gene27172-35093_t
MKNTLPLPLPLNVVDTLPGRLSDHPLLSDPYWILRAPFDAQVFFSASPSAVLPRTMTSHDDVDTPSPRSANVSLDSDVVDVFETYASDVCLLLSQWYCDQYVALIRDPVAEDGLPLSLPSAVSNGGYGGSSTAMNRFGSTDSDGATASKKPPLFVLPPPWTTAAPANHLLGETIIYLRCASNPIDAPPSPPKGLPTFPLRVALCGVSEYARRVVGDCLKDQLGLAVISVEELLKRALAVGERAVGIPKERRSSVDLPSLHVFSQARSGKVIPEEAYVSLVLEEILTLDPSRGFVLVDFPNTKEEARKLVQALSGIDYDAPRPNALQRASEWASACRDLHLEDMKGFDPSKCGLDLVCYLDCDAEKLVTRSLGERMDLRTREVVYVTDDALDSVQYLANVTAPLQVKEMCAVGLTMAMDAAEDLQEFLSKLHLLRTVNLDDYESVDIAATE